MNKDLTLKYVYFSFIILVNLNKNSCIHNLLNFRKLSKLNITLIND